MADSKKIDDGGAAFPQLEVTSGERDGHGDLIEPFTSAAGGMSLRDWFAGQALISLTNMAGDDGYFKSDKQGPNAAQLIAFTAYVVADAMIATRKAGA